MARLATLKPIVATMPSLIAKHSDVRDKVVEWRGWYKLARWKELRARVLERHGFTCAKCGWQDAEMVSLHRALSSVGVWEHKHIKAPNLVADHVTPHRGDPSIFWHEPGIQCLCKPCHDGAKQREERARR